MKKRLKTIGIDYLPSGEDFPRDSKIRKGFVGGFWKCEEKEVRRACLKPKVLFLTRGGLGKIMRMYLTQSDFGETNLGVWEDALSVRASESLKPAHFFWKDGVVPSLFLISGQLLDSIPSPFYTHLS
ncbi:hypothetical protein Tco_0773861 [Tanacetum coccineum]|uniref:Sulfotransferase n=1 Tax=Tanacetum coccineum TaxID=301880 RepID=A0ABQ4ZQD5_9ASTR